MKNPKILAEWIKFTNRGSNWKPSRWNSICSRHFDKSNFREYLSRKCLKKEAIPTIATNTNISYETYHISTGSPDDTRTAQSELDDFRSPAETFDFCKTSSETIEMCRLCGERADNLTCNPLKSLDDAEINLLCRKCLPSLNTYRAVDQSQAICTDCVTQLKQYSDFIDKVFSYQRELGLGENVDSNTISENSNLIDVNRMNNGIKPSTSNPTSMLFIKQEPINVKQEIMDNSHRKPITTQIPSCSPSLCPNPFAEAKKIKGFVQQEIIDLPKTEFSTTFCQECDRIFGNSHEYRSHECSCTVQNNDREQGNNNNCEIMEVITLNNNPISFIDLAEDENVTNVELRKPKPEGLIEFEERERLEFEHGYAKRPANTSCNLKQEIIDSYNDTSHDGFDCNESEGQTLTNQCSRFDETVHIFDCTKCQQSFVSQQLLDEHSNKLHPMIHKICSICGAEFKSSYEFLIHKSKVHTQRFQCKKCKQKFHTKSALRFHKRFCSCESKDFCFSCRHCGKRQRNFATMLKHLNNCMGKKADSLEELQQYTRTMSQNESLQTYGCKTSIQSLLRQISFVSSTYFYSN